VTMYIMIHDTCIYMTDDDIMMKYTSARVKSDLKGKTMNE